MFLIKENRARPARLSARRCVPRYLNRLSFSSGHTMYPLSSDVSATCHFAPLARSSGLDLESGVARGQPIRIWMGLGHSPPQAEHCTWRHRAPRFPISVKVLKERSCGPSEREPCALQMAFTVSTNEKMKRGHRATTDRSTYRRPAARPAGVAIARLHLNPRLPRRKAARKLARRGDTRTTCERRRQVRAEARNAGTRGCCLSRSYRPLPYF